MSRSDYPLFSKRIQKSQKNWRGGYNFEKSKEYELAEKWFEERKETKKDSRPPSPMIQSPPPTKTIKGPPPGLSKPIPVRDISCFKCKNTQINLIMMGCCASCFCTSCMILQSEIYNRCFKCKKVIDMTKYKEYEDLDLNIPSYDEFDYNSPDDPVTLTFIPLNKNTTPKISHKLSISAQEFIPNDVLRSDELRMNINENFELYMNYINLYNLIASCL
jgi:hypothetical protein